MKSIGNILRKYIVTYVLLVICCIFISSKTLATPESITTADCWNIYQYLKNINDPCSTENHGDQLIGHLSKLCTRIFDKNLEKEKIKFKEIYSIISNSGMHPHLSTSTIIPYTYNISGHSRPIICAFQTINRQKKHIITINFFLACLQKKEDEGCAIMFRALRSCMQTAKLQMFVKCVKDECLTIPSIASAPPLEKSHPQRHTGDYPRSYTPDEYNHNHNHYTHNFLPPQQQACCFVPKHLIPHLQTTEKEQHYPKTPDLPPPAYTEKDTGMYLTSLELPSAAKKDGLPTILRNSYNSLEHTARNSTKRNHMKMN